MLSSLMPNTTPPPSLLWITDPWSTLDTKKDTTLRLAHEAKNLGIGSWWSSSEMVFSAKKNLLRVISAEKAPDPAFAVDLPASNFFQIHFRVDPPVDENYRKLIRDMEERIAGGSRLLNPPELLLGQSEKLPPPELSDLAPGHRVIASAADIASAHPVTLAWDRWVTKPMNLAQSRGVRLWEKTADPAEFRKIMEQEAEGLGYPILVEEFLPGIAGGEVRLWFACGRLIGALKKFPLAGDFRVLIDSGSRIEPHTLTPEEEKISARISRALENQQIALAAVDLIDGRICDYNITSPGLLVQLEEVHGKNLAKTVVENLILGFRRKDS